MEIREIKGDLFESDKKYAFAQCIAQDIGMGAGIAVQFRQNYPDMKRTLQSTQPGYVYPAVAKYIAPDGRVIYNLITKKNSSFKPHREGMHDALVKLRQQCDKDGTEYLAMPLIGAGLDGLDWETTKQDIIDLFTGDDCSVKEILIVHYYKKDNLLTRLIGILMPSWKYSR